MKGMESARGADGGLKCRVCGEQLAVTDRACPICLEPRRRQAARRLRRNQLLAWVVLPILFLGSCTAFLPLGRDIADPMTHMAVERLPEMRFPLVVIARGAPRVLLLTDPHRLPALPPDASYLIPEGADQSVETALNASLRAGTEGGWVLRVRRRTPTEQRIDLVWMNDGYAGGVYEATATTIRPLYRKFTGPGFAFLFGGVALVLNAALWTVLLVGIRWWLRRPKS